MDHHLSHKYSIGCSMHPRARATFSIDDSLFAWALPIVPSFPS